MRARELRRRLEERARAEGFDRVGVAAAERLDRDLRALEAWLERGREASMTWMSRRPERRADPRLLLSGCRSVVTLAMNHGPGAELADEPTPGGRVARYARGRDYHKVMGKKLKRLASWLEEVSAAPTRAFVDTAPILERAWAERSGIGWIGKNANLITRDLGSWVLLGELLTVAQLEPDPGPHRDFCGSCSACMTACPTAAIVEPGVVDSGRCVAYWTIERRGPVAISARSGLGDWVFGCDICQEVCPWNRRFSKPVPPERFEARNDLSLLDPEELLALDEAEFRSLYSGTSLMRAMWSGMRRNACIVLGNQRRRGSTAILGEAIRDRDPVVRSHAAWALGRIGGSRAGAVLREAAEVEHDPDVAEEIRRAVLEQGEE